MAVDLETLPEDVVLPWISEIAVPAHDLTPQFEQVVRAFPGLQVFTLFADPEREVDVAPLAGLAGLAELHANDLHLTGTEHLAPTVRILT